MTYCIHCDEEHGEAVDFCPKTGRPIADVMQRMLGRTIAGRYKLVKCIGQGGMGTIFEAEHTLIGCLNFSFYDWSRRTPRLKQAGRGGMGTVLRNKKVKALVAKALHNRPRWQMRVEVP